MPHWITADSSTISHSRRPARTGMRDELAARGASRCGNRDAIQCGSGAQLDAKLRDFRRMLRVARHVAEMAQTRTIGRARAFHPGQRKAGDHACREERKLEARIRERGRFPEQNHQRRERDRVQQLDAAKQRPRAQIERGHQRGAQNRRAILHHAHVACERDEGHKLVAKIGESQPAADPKKEHDERADVQARDHEHVIRGGFLKRGDDLRIDEAAVAKQHRAQHGRALRLAREKRVEPREQIAASAREPLRKCRARAVDQLQQFAAAQRAGEVDFLPREVAAFVECARIEKIARRARPHERFDAIARAQASRRAFEMFRAVKIQPQPTAHRHRRAADSTCSRSIS